MSLDIGINCRATSTYVTDNPNETYTLGEAYPTTRGGATFGWDTDLTSNTRDRDSGLDRRLAGIVFNNTVGRYFQIDLQSATDHDVHCAAGDAGSGNAALWDFQDNTTVFDATTGDPVDAIGGFYKDATDAKYANAGWPGSETAISRTFGSTVFRFQIRAAAVSVGNSTVAHLRLVQTGGGGATAVPMLTLLGVG
jgi:hypothetical protein